MNSRIVKTSVVEINENSRMLVEGNSVKGQLKVNGGWATVVVGENENRVRVQVANFLVKRKMFQVKNFEN